MRTIVVYFNKDLKDKKEVEVSKNATKKEIKEILDKKFGKIIWYSYENKKSK